MIPQKSQQVVDVTPTVLNGSFTGSTNINSAGAKVFTYSGTLEFATKYKRTIQFDVRSTTLTGTVDHIELNWPTGNENDSNVGTLEYRADGSTTFQLFSHQISSTSLITTSGVGTDTFTITVVNGATTSLDVSSMNAMYEKVKFD